MLWHWAVLLPLDKVEEGTIYAAVLCTQLGDRKYLRYLPAPFYGIVSFYHGRRWPSMILDTCIITSGVAAAEVYMYRALDYSAHKAPTTRYSQQRSHQPPHDFSA